MSSSNDSLTPTTLPDVVGAGKRFPRSASGCGHPSQRRSRQLQNHLCKILFAVYRTSVTSSPGDDPRRRPRTSGPLPIEGATLPGGWPTWFDPTRDALLTPRRLRGLVHPIRLRLLTLLQEDGPATASQLGRRIGQSSGVTSYHLRILAEHGFIDDDTERSNGRDRWWRSRYRTTAFTLRSPDDPLDAEGVEVAEQYVRMVVDQTYARMVAYVDSFIERGEDLARLPWTFGDATLRLTIDEARELTGAVNRLLEPYRRTPVDRVDDRPDAVDATFMFQLLPDDQTDDQPDEQPDGEPDAEP
jgi:DNA-binding transcriptional ArsR family regulator